MFDVINENLNFFFNDLSLSCLLACENFEDFINSLIAFIFNELNQIVEKSDKSILKKILLNAK